MLNNLVIASAQNFYIKKVSKSVISPFETPPVPTNETPNLSHTVNDSRYPLVL